MVRKIPPPPKYFFKTEWEDIFIGQTLRYEWSYGKVVTASKKDNLITLDIEGNLETYKIEQLSYTSYVQPHVIFNMGEYMTTFAYLENFLRDSYYNTFRMTKLKKKVIYTIDTAKTLMLRVSKLIEATVEKDSEAFKEWADIERRLGKAIKFRNGVIHGSLLRNTYQQIEILNPNDKYGIKAYQPSFHGKKRLLEEIEKLSQLQFDVFVFFHNHRLPIADKLSTPDSNYIVEEPTS